MELWWQDQSNKDWCLSVAMVLMWYIWKCRNEAIFEHKLSLPGVVCKRAVEYLHEFLVANSLNTTTVVSNEEGATSSWIRPPDGMFKINVDGSWKKELGKGGYDIVFRDSKGFFAAVSMGVLQWFASSFVAEALAIR